MENNPSSIKKNILVTGANGQLGQEFAHIENEFPAYKFIFVTKAQLSITDENAVNDFNQRVGN